MDLTDRPEEHPLRILPLRFRLYSEGIKFPTFPGNVWHGCLGAQLAKTSPHAFGLLYQTSDESRLYAINPGAQEVIPKGDCFDLRITLFGPGIQCALNLAQALAQLGKTGLKQSGQYRLLQASYITPTDEIEFISEQAGYTGLPESSLAQAFIQAAQDRRTQCTVNLRTPLRIKEGNKIQMDAPAYAHLVRRTLSRLDQLAYIAKETPPLAKAMRPLLQEEAAAVQIQSAELKPYRLERRSARSGQSMSIEGLTGSITYQGNIEQTLPWLRLAELIQIGGKTAFGFGGIEIQPGTN